MHIADGVVPAGVAAAADVAALGMIYLGGRKVETEEIPRLGIFAVALFVVSLIHFPIGATSIHLGLYGMAGLLFGLRSIPVIFVSLLFQVLIFGHGGLLAIGLNTLVMGSGALAAWAVWKWLPLPRQVNSFLCGFLGILLPAVLVAVVLLFSLESRGMWFIVSVNLPAAVVEGVLTVGIYNFFTRVKPEVLQP
jgi:cobalt/nickel transport system permease protein